MEKGFKVHRFDYDEGPEVGGDFEQAARHGLEIALKDIRENRLSGARVTIEARCSHHEHPPREFTVSVYDSTGQKDCVWCNGTGVEGS
jgi:hypothetical protein